jgi:phosphoglycolate phosphatase-like HAD superfamily hydrolase
MRHVIWDWNGTLVDDLSTVVDCVSASLASIGEAPIIADDYRDHYTRPVRLFYERLLERPVTDAEWSSINVTFHDAYAALAHGIPLAADAREAIETVANAGGSQSILSMWWHENLVPEVERHGLERFMLRVDGNTHDAGETKQRLLEIHLRELATGNGAVMVGDALDDARAALDAGIPCVMYNGGSHYRSELEELGVPVADSLLEAARIALES